MRTMCPKEQQIHSSLADMCKFYLGYIFTLESQKFDYSGTRGGEDCWKIRSVQYYYKPHGN